MSGGLIILGVIVLGLAAGYSSDALTELDAEDDANG